VIPLKVRAIPFTGLDRPLVFQELEAPRISRPSAQEGGKTVNLKHRPPLSPRKSIVLISVGG